MEVRTVCRSCWAGCGVLVDVEDGAHVTGIRGDREHPFSKGYMCPKGSAIPWAHNRPDRLNYPTLHGQRAAWRAVLDDLAGKIKDAIAAHGPNAVGLYMGSACGILDTLGMRPLRRFLPALGSQQLYSPNTVDVAPALKASELVTGYATELTPRWVPEDEDVKLLIYVGSNPVVSHGYFTVLPDAARQLRRFQQRGGKLWVIDPVETRTARIADAHLAPIPGTDPLLLAWLVKEVLARMPDDAPALATTKAEDRARLRAALQSFDVDTVADRCGVTPEILKQLSRDIATAGRMAMICGTGLTFGPHGVLGEWLRWALLILTDSLDRPGGMWIDPGWLACMEARTAWSPAPEEGLATAAPASRPDLPRIGGETPCAALADEIESGTLRVLLVAGGSPLTAIPDPARLERAFQKLDTLAVIDVIPTPLTAMASHVLPGADQLERLDINGFWTGHPQLAVPAVAPVAERRPPWYIIGQLAKRLDILKPVLDGFDPDVVSEEQLVRAAMAHARHTFDEVRDVGPHGLTNPRIADWAMAHALPDGTWRVAPAVLVARLPALLARQTQDSFPLLLTSRRQLRRVNSTENAKRAREAEAAALLLTAEDARRYGIADGDQVRVRSANGEVTAQAAIDPRLRPGVVSLPHGWHEANATHLTSCYGIDPLTSQPQMSAIPVAIEAVVA
jgi:anaerobic selenocysteine-containing dehydrogenase